MMGMKVDLSDITGSLPSAEDLIKLMMQDKKVVDGQLRLVLARDIGDVFVTADVDSYSVLNLLSESLRLRG
jgi:3-dehydroquinate synthase